MTDTPASKLNKEMVTYGSGKHVKHESTKTPPINSLVVTTVYHNLRSPDITQHNGTNSSTVTVTLFLPETFTVKFKSGKSYQFLDVFFPSKF